MFLLCFVHSLSERVTKQLQQDTVIEGLNQGELYIAMLFFEMVKIDDNQNADILLMCT